MGVEMWLDATPYGKPVYEKHGFVDLGPNPLIPAPRENAGEAWKEIDQRLQPMVFWTMWRPKGGIYEEGKTVKPWEEE